MKKTHCQFDAVDVICVTSLKRWKCNLFQYAPICWITIFLSLQINNHPSAAPATTTCMKNTTLFWTSWQLDTPPYMYSLKSIIVVQLLPAFPYGVSLISRDICCFNIWGVQWCLCLVDCALHKYTDSAPMNKMCTHAAACQLSMLSFFPSELYSSILPCHESSSQTCSSTCQTAPSTSYSFLSQRCYHQHGHCSCGSGFHDNFFKAPPPPRSFPPEFTYSPPSLADQKPLSKFHLREEHMDANPENETKHQQPNEHCCHDVYRDKNPAWPSSFS